MSKDAAHAWWMDQFVPSRHGANGALAPFPQAIEAAEMLVAVAQDRVNVPRPSYDAVGTLRYQAQLLADFARSLEDDLARHAEAAEDAVSMRAVTNDQTSQRARQLMAALSGALQAVATLSEVCQALVLVAEGLLVITRPRSRASLIASVEAVRCAASTCLVTVHASVGRITDAVLYDRLQTVAGTVEATLARAEEVSSVIRAGTRRPGVPAQRHDLSEAFGTLPG